MVKIDGSFICNLPENPANMIFIRSLLDLARDFGLDTVAECVETLEQMEMLRKEGVGFLQGWAFGKPIIRTAVAERERCRRRRGGAVTKIRSVDG